MQHKNKVRREGNQRSGFGWRNWLEYTRREETRADEEMVSQEREALNEEPLTEGAQGHQASGP